MIAQELEVSLHMAFVEARQKRHEFITVEHLLLALLDNPTAAEVLRACGANMDELRKNLTQHITEQTPRIAADREVDTQPTLGFQRVIQRAILHVQSSGKKEVTGANVLVAIFGEKDSHAVYFLQQQGIARLDVVNYISHGITKTPQAHPGKTDQDSEQEGQAETSNSPLDNYTQNLNALALAGKIDPLIGRDKELERVVQTLCRRRKNNPLLVGEAGVGKTANALTTAAELSARYINDRHLPDKAIDVIDEAGAAQRIAPKAKQKRIIGKAEIEEIIAKIARIPPRSVSTDDRSALANLDRDLKAVVFGQDKAIDALASAIKMARSGLGNPQKPIGNFLFSGPTGVGKTEVARQLAYCMGIELIRFDMSEYMERHAVSRLIGAPPGYVGFDQGGLLTEQITKHPYSVLLLDEIEKAHPDIFNILLQVMDHGTLTDNNGRKADFRNVCIVMTTNAGAESLARPQMGFTPTVKAGDEMEAIKRMFTPEFRNRLDAIISFGALDEKTIMRVVEKFLMQLDEQLAEKKVEAQFTEALKAHLAKKGFDPLMGARPMARLIQDTIRRALADELLFGRLQHGGKVTIDLGEDEKIVLKFEEEPAATA